METEFLGKLESSNLFSAQKQVVSKKKKKKVFTEIESDFSARIGNSNVFSHRIKTSTSRLRHPISFGAGCFQLRFCILAIFTTKTCDFAYFTSQWGGSSPPPGYATGYIDVMASGQGCRNRGGMGEYIAPKNLAVSPH